MTRLLDAAQTFDLAQVANLVRAGQHDDRAFLSDQGSTLCPDEPHTPLILAKLREQGRACDNEDEALFELYETLLLAGHPVPDGSVRRCVVRVIAGADVPRHDRALKLMKLCLDEVMLDWRTSAWAQQIKLDTPNALHQPLHQPLDLHGEAIGQAAQAGHLAMLQLLVDGAPADPEVRREAFRSATCPVYKAIWSGSQACVDYLLSIMDEKSWLRLSSMVPTPFVFVAGCAGQDQIVRALVARGADINALDGRQEQGIMTGAMQAKHPSIVPTLLALGADPNAGKPNQPNALHMAAWQGYAYLVPDLVAAGADLESRDGSHKTPLGTAAMVGCAKSALALLAAGACLEVADEQARTPMHWACGNDRVEVFEALRAAGARMDVRDLGGQTPEDLAKPKVKARIEALRLEQDTQPASAPRHRTRI